MAVTATSSRLPWLPCGSGGNKGDRGVLVEQADDGFGLLWAYIQFLGYDGCVVLHACSLSV